MNDEQECERRQRERKEFARRFLFANAGTLLTLAAVLVQGGRILAEVEQAAKLAQFAVSEQQIIRNDVTAVRLDMAEVKGAIRTHDKEIDLLQREANGNGIYNRQQRNTK